MLNANTQGVTGAAHIATVSSVPSISGTRVIVQVDRYDIAFAPNVQLSDTTVRTLVSYANANYGSNALRLVTARSFNDGTNNSVVIWQNSVVQSTSNLTNSNTVTGIRLGGAMNSSGANMNVPWVGNIAAVSVFNYIFSDALRKRLDHHYARSFRIAAS